MLAHGGALRSAEESLGRDEATGLQAQWLKTNLWRVGDYGFRNAIPCDTHGSHLPLWYCEKQYCLHAAQDFPWVCLRACFFSFCAERTTLFNLHTTPGHLTLSPKKHAVEQKTIFWHEESIVLQLSFFVVSDCRKSGRANQKWLKSFLGPRGRSEANMKKLQLDVGNLCPGWCWCPLFQPPGFSGENPPAKLRTCWILPNPYPGGLVRWRCRKPGKPHAGLRCPKIRFFVCQRFLLSFP